MPDTEKTPSTIYSLKREELQAELDQRGLETEGTVEELRKRLSQALKTEREAKSRKDAARTATGKSADMGLDFPSTSKRGMETQVSEGRFEERLLEPTTEPNHPWTHMTDGEIMDKVRKWNIKFDNGQDPLAFIERIKELADCYEIPVEGLFKALPELLTKNALAWYRNNRMDWSCWEDFLEAFKEFYLPPRYQIRLAEEIRNRVQRSGEKVKDFVTALQSLMRWHSKLNRQEKLERIYDNLRTDYRLYIRRKDFTTLGELVRMAEEYESLKAEEQKTHVPRNTTPRQNPHDRNQILTIKENFSREQCYWRCGQRGHRKSQCKNRPVLFCSRCGRQDVLTRNCKCSREHPDASTRSDQKQKLPESRVSYLSSNTQTAACENTATSRLIPSKTSESRETSQIESLDDSRYFLPVQILDVDCAALADTGAGRSFIGDMLLQRIRTARLEAHTCNFVTNLADGSEVGITCFYNLTVRIGKRAVQHQFYHMPGLSETLLLGIDFLKKCGLKMTLWGEEPFQEAPVLKKTVTEHIPSYQNQTSATIKPEKKTLKTTAPSIATYPVPAKGKPYKNIANQGRPTPTRPSLAPPTEAVSHKRTAKDKGKSKESSHANGHSRTKYQTPKRMGQYGGAPGKPETQKADPIASGPASPTGMTATVTFIDPITEALENLKMRSDQPREVLIRTRGGPVRARRLQNWEYRLRWKTTTTLIRL